jgi:uncharacterized membrane protein
MSSPRSGWRLPRWVTVVSLTLNLFFVGVALGLAAVHMPFGSPFAGDDGERRSGLYFELRGYADSLSEAHQQAIREQLALVMPEVDDLRARLRELREEIAELVVEPEPDRAAIDARLEEIRTLTNEMQEVVQRQGFDALLALPAEARGDLELAIKSPRR